VTRLRKMMLEELQRRNYSAITTRNYLRVVTEFAKYFGKSPDKLSPNELRTYQAYLLTERKLTPGTVVNRVAALRFFFVKTLKRHQFRDFLPDPQDRRRLPTVLSQDEVARLINAAATPTIRTAFPPRLAALPKLCSDPRCCSNPIAHRVRRKRQRLPPKSYRKRLGSSSTSLSEFLPEPFPIKPSDDAGVIAVPHDRQGGWAKS
jgi:integrase